MATIEKLNVSGCVELHAIWLSRCENMARQECTRARSVNINTSTGNVPKARNITQAVPREQWERFLVSNAAGAPQRG